MRTRDDARQPFWSVVIVSFYYGQDALSGLEIVLSRSRHKQLPGILEFELKFTSQLLKQKASLPSVLLVDKYNPDPMMLNWMTVGALIAITMSLLGMRIFNTLGLKHRLPTTSLRTHKQCETLLIEESIKVHKRDQDLYRLKLIPRFAAAEDVVFITEDWAIFSNLDAESLASHKNEKVQNLASRPFPHSFFQL